MLLKQTNDFFIQPCFQIYTYILEYYSCNVETSQASFIRLHENTLNLLFSCCRFWLKPGTDVYFKHNMNMGGGGEGEGRFNDYGISS